MNLIEIVDFEFVDFFIVMRSPLFVNKLSDFYTHISTGDSIGAPEGIRTPDPQLRRLLLYPPELQAHSKYGIRNGEFGI